jgi:hypothetical protein
MSEGNGGYQGQAGEGEAMTQKEAKELTLELWRYLAEHPECYVKSMVPQDIYDKVKTLDSECPLCEVFNLWVSKRPRSSRRTDRQDCIGLEAGGGMMKLIDLFEDHPLATFLSFVAVCLVVLFILIYANPVKDKIPEPDTRSSIYITRTDHVRTLEGETVWILEYTVDGRFEAPAFTSHEAMTEYREYLDTIGKVYQREEENHVAE